MCGAGTVAALFGLIICLEPLALWKRGLALAMGIAGISAIYLSHVRVSFVVTLGMMATYVVMLTVQKQTKRLAGFSMLSVGLVVGGLSLATLLGGASINERFSTLTAGDPRKLYYQSRGMAVEYGFSYLLSEYPLGAGLARWGMMRSYFGDPAKLDSTELFAEVQPNAWILDGGIFLLVMYGVALMTTAMYDLKLLRTLANREDRLWAAAVVAANFGTHRPRVQLRALWNGGGDAVLVPRGCAARRDGEAAAVDVVKRWLLVAGDFTPLGGMDAANHALARYLAADGDVHLVTHRAWADLHALPERHGPMCASSVRASRTRQRTPGAGRRARVEAAAAAGGAANRQRRKLPHPRRRQLGSLPPCGLSADDRDVEARPRQGARSFIAAISRPNAPRSSRRRSSSATAGGRVTTSSNMSASIASQVRVVYYGGDPIRFSHVTPERTHSGARAIRHGRPIDLLVAFVGALGDRRKAFDTVFAAWVRLCSDPHWDADLVVAGSGARTTHVGA